MEPELDPIPRWTRLVRARLRSGSTGKPGLRLRVTFEFAFLAFLGTCASVHPAPELGLLLLPMMLVHELPLAIWARALGRFVQVAVHATGARTEISGEAVPVRRRLFLALAGSVASCAVGYALLVLARVAHSAVLGEAGRLQLFWGVVQLVPLTPFKLGSLLREQVRHWTRVKHAIASLGVALAAFFRGASYLQAPLLLVGVSIWLYACGRELIESVARARDARLAAEQRLAKISALTQGDEPEQALRLARHLLRRARSRELRARAGRALAWAAIGSGDVVLARDAMSKLPEGELDAQLLASYLATSNRPGDAIALLEYAHGLGVRTSESLRLLADLYYRLRDHEALSRLARSSADVLSKDELTKIERALATSPYSAAAACPPT